jgi:hypothetical protein
VTACQVARAIALGAAYEPFTAALAARAWRWARQQLHRSGAPREPQTPQELMAYARSIQHTMPTLAAELNGIALRRPDASGGNAMRD